MELSKTELEILLNFLELKFNDFEDFCEENNISLDGAATILKNIAYLIHED